MTKIRAQDLEGFADRNIARDVLPELIRRLIRATCDRVEDVYFPAGESTFRPGVDGIVRASGMPPFVPGGVSVWEVGTNQDPRAKVRADFESRSGSTHRDEYNETRRAEATFVAVSLRRINATRSQDRDELETDLKGRGVWRDVKIIDADHLEIWLDETPSVRAWLGAKMEKAVPDMRDLQTLLDRYCQGTRYVLPAGLLIANREKCVEKVRESAANGEFTRIRADSPKEAAAFAAAAITSLDAEDPQRNALLAKAIAIDDPASREYLRDTKNKLLVLTQNLANSIASELAHAGHTVFVCHGSSHAKGAGQSPLIVLPRASQHQFTEALKAGGVPDDEARRSAIACHSSVSVYRRQNDPAHAENPDWAQPARLRNLIAPILVGAFVHTDPEDQALVHAVSGEADYEVVERNIVDVLRVDEAPVLREGKLTALSAPADIWQLSIEHQIITRTALERFRDAALRVLSEPDPALDLPPEKRAYADLYGKKRQYSGTLRSGIAEILRLIAINEEGLGYIGGFSAQQFVDGILRSVPGLATDYRMLASLDSLLPILAEAAPVPFLTALEGLTSADSTVLAPIFEGGDDAMFGRAYYLGALRALEVLAWDPDRLEQVSMQLAKLSVVDPGGKLSNRPINSLVQIYLPWLPHTNASPAVRHSILRKVCDAVPSIAWSLVSELLPTDRGISFGTAEPEWRDSGASERPELTNISVARDYEFIIDLAASHAGEDAERWYEIVRAAGECRFHDKFDSLLRTIEERRDGFRSAQTDRVLWEKLSELANRHYGFEDADWAMLPEQIARLEATVALFTPEDISARYRPLFNSYLLDRSEPNETIEQREERAGRERDHAVLQIAQQGVGELIRFAESVKTPQLLAASIARLEDPELARAIVLEGYDKSDAIAWLVAIVTANGVAKFGLAWGAQTLSLAAEKGAAPAQLAALVVPWDDTREMIDFVRSQPGEFQEAYWEVRDFYIRSDDPALVSEIVDELIGHHRSHQLIQFLGAKASSTPSETLLVALEQGFDEITQDLQRVHRIDRYWLRKVFFELGQRTDFDRERLMGLEYRWLPLLHGYGEPQHLALHDYLGASPEFFVQVLSDLYKSNAEVEQEGGDEGEGEKKAAASSDEIVREEGDGERSVETADRRARADSAYKLLESWQSLPWKTAEGELDAPAIVEWIRRSLELAAAAGRAEVGAREIGKLLAYAPIDDEDAVWPATEIREVLEAVANDDLENGIVLELFNKRGVHWRPPEGGGEPERRLASDASAAAKALGNRWPRTARMLRRNAEQWMRHGEWEDRRAAEQKIQL